MQKTVRWREINLKIAVQILFWVCSFSVCTAQTVDEQGSISKDSLVLQTVLPDSISLDSLTLQNDFADSIQTDSLTLQDEISDSISEVETMRMSPNAITSIVDYFAQDSVEFDIKNKKALLFNNTNLLYEDIELKSSRVQIDFSKNELHAEGITDSNAVLQGTPVFKQGEWEFKSHELDYNFNSKKGLIKHVITQEGEGFLHGEIVKKNADNTSYIRHGKYTTCNLECPHFEIDFGKAKVIPNDKIITGPLYLRIANIPTFLALPFGFFPNSNKRTNGLLMPAYNISNIYGIYLTGLGYYFALKDRVDFAITTDVYMQQAFGVELKSNYIKRYKCNGMIDIKYDYLPTGERKTELFQPSHELKVVWRHQQDRKSHPTNSFSANVDFQTANYGRNTGRTDYNTRTKSASYSSVNFSTSFKSRYSLGINANISQNLSTGDLGLDLPQINFNMPQFYPLRRKKVVGKLRWYEEISMQYTANMRNGMQTNDSILFKQPAEAFRAFNSELNQSIPIKSTIKIFKHLSWNNSISLSEIWQIKGVYQSWEKGWDTLVIQGRDSIVGRGIVTRDTVYGFFATHNLSFNSDLSTTLYGMYIMKKGRVYAFRHTLIPSVGFTYRPNINRHNYKTYYDSIRNEAVEYDVTNRNFGKTSASVNFSLNNRLEMKVRTKKKHEDDEEDFKKVTLLESFSISTFYDFMRDSLRLDMINISGRTLIFRHINLNFGLRLDPYAYDDSLGRRINVTELQKNHRLLRLSSTAWNVTCGLNLNKNFFKPKNREPKEETTTYGFKDWSISLNYTFSYNMDDNPFYYTYHRLRTDTVILQYTHRFNNTLNFSGNIPFTSKWSLGFQSGYDFTKKQMSYSRFTIERDLHCWRMEFIWEPFGPYRHFEFLIQAKASMLRDVKWNPKRDYREGM